MIADGSSGPVHVRRVDYDSVAPAFDRRYAKQSFIGIQRALASFLGLQPQRAILEIGCGTGHWLHLHSDATTVVAGADRSMAMLERARVAAPHAHLVRATAEFLPFVSGSFDRAFCINALHHFEDQEAFVRECRRILGGEGAFLTIGLDPHTGLDQWWVYDYFPAALAADLQRYLPTERIRQILGEAGFAAATTEIVHHVPAQRHFDVAVEQGLLDRRSTSQLMVISDAEYEAGVQRLFRDRPVFRSDLRLFGTVAHVRASA